jgi:periplasmic divalent cation tolerance protein
MTDKIVAFSTCGSLQEARAVAQALVESRLAACVNIVPGVTSIYRWKGVVEEASELLLLIKSTAELMPQVVAKLREVHSYEVPELIAVPIAAGLPDYLAWIGAETGSLAQSDD